MKFKKLDSSYICSKVFELAKASNSRVRLILVYNPRSSEATRVNTEVTEPIRQILFGGNGTQSDKVTLIKYEVQPTNVDDNANRLAFILQENDVVVAAGGDATAAIAVNGIMLSGHECYFSALMFGNFSDTARLMLRAVNRDKGDVFYPLKIEINDNHFRFAVCYFTVGMMAEATEIFDNEKIRSHLRKHKSNLIYSLSKLAGWYFKHKNKVFIPDFMLRRSEKFRDGDIFKIETRVVEGKDVSDIMFINSETIAKMMKGGSYYTSMSDYMSYVGWLKKIINMIGFMFPSIFSKVPGKISVRDEVYFKDPASIEVQAEGEYLKLNAVESIKVHKAENFIKIL